MLNTKYNLDFIFCENSVIVFSVENTRVFSDIILNIYLQSEGGVGDFILSENEKEFVFSKKVCFIDNPLTVSQNDKRLISKLYKEIEELILNQYSNLNDEYFRHIISFMDQCLQLVPYHLQYDYEVNLGGLLKLYNVSFIDEDVTSLGKVISYIKIMHQLLGTEIFIFRNLKCFLNKDELLTLYKECNYEKVYLFLIEGNQFEKLQGEKCCILDKDLCIINI